MKYYITVIVCTLNRSDKLRNCITSIMNNTFTDFEIVLIDQSNSDLTKEVVKKFETKKVNYFKMYDKGKSKAINMAISKASGDILSFTDDDCIVDKDWLKNIKKSFQEYEDITGVFGKVMPFEPSKNIDKICPCTFLKVKKRIISKPIIHWENIGFGNNMAYRRKVFNQIGGFKKWLGPGSIGSNAEDAEFAFRVLSNGYKLLYNPQISVYHNRWLTKEEFKKQRLSYSCGEVACYGYYALQGETTAKKILYKNFFDSYYKIKKSIKNIVLFKKNGYLTMFNTLEESIFRLRGLLVALYFSKFVTIPEKE